MKAEIQKIFSDLSVQKNLTEKFQVEFIVLFGSMASGSIKPDSDIDLGIRFEKELSDEEERDLVHYLRTILKVDRVDAVCLNHAPSALRYELTQHGVLLYAQNEDDYIDFCIRAFKEYEEMNILNRHYHQEKIVELKRFANAES